MDEKKRERLKVKGCKIGNADDLLGLSKEEAECIELKIAIALVDAKESLLSESLN